MKHEVASEKEEREVIQNITNLPTPLIYIRHIYYLRFEKLARVSPLYINIIRDPVRDSSWC